jgi:hypothetical protein
VQPKRLFDHIITSQYCKFEQLHQILEQNIQLIFLSQEETTSKLSSHSYHPTSKSYIFFQLLTPLQYAKFSSEKQSKQYLRFLLFKILSHITFSEFVIFIFFGNCKLCNLNLLPILTTLSKLQLKYFLTSFS